MRVGILTFINTVNFGASLQAVALQNVIRSFGYQSDIIQYTNKDIEDKEKGKSRKSIKAFIKSIRMGSVLKRKRISFDKYEQKAITKGVVLTDNTKAEVEHMYDCFVTGSDQVWNMNITHGDWTYFLDFISNDERKISYAPSFGNVAFPKDYYPKAKELLLRIPHLSVREYAGKKTIEEIAGIEAAVVVDPTLLLDKKQWLSDVRYVPPLDHYILVYFPHNKRKVFDFVQSLRKHTGLPVVYLSISPKPQRGVKTIYDASPEEFMSWIEHADYVVTGSFHGTAFSLNFEKQFFYEPSGTNSRIESITSLTGTQDRSIENSKVFESDIDYSIVNEKLKAARKSSISWLREALKEVEDYGKTACADK